MKRTTRSLSTTAMMMTTICSTHQVPAGNHQEADRRHQGQGHQSQAQVQGHLSRAGNVAYCIVMILTMMICRERGKDDLDRVKRIWYLSPMRAAKVQASLRIRAVSPEPSLLAHTSSESRGTFRQKARSLTSLNGWACAVKICHDGMLEDTNSLDGAHLET